MIGAYSTIDWGGVLSGVIANAIWFAISVATAAAFITWHKDRSKFHGRWRATITWSHDWGNKLLGATPEQPHSEGEISLSYGAGSKKNQYWGLSVWTFKDGTNPKAELCVEITGIEVKKPRFCKQFPCVQLHTLARARLSSRIRRELGSFKYPISFANYEIDFKKSTADELEGQIVVKRAKPASDETVGDFVAERVS